MNKTVETITGLKPVMDFEAFNEVLDQVGIEEGMEGKPLLDGFCEMLDDWSLYEKAYHPRNSWHNLLFYQGRFKQAYHFQYFSYLFGNCVNTLYHESPPFFKGKCEEYMAQASKRMGMFNVMVPQALSLEKNHHLGLIEEIIKESSNKDGIFFGRFPEKIIIFCGSVHKDICWKIQLQDSDIYQNYRKRVKSWHLDYLNYCQNNNAVSSEARLYSAGDALFGLFFQCLLDDDWTDYNGDSLDDVFSYFKEKKTADFRKSYKELTSKRQQPGVIVPSLVELLSIRRELKKLPVNKRGKGLKKINRSIHNWLKKACFEENSKSANSSEWTWEPFLIKYLLLADLEIDTEDSKEFFTVFREIGNAFPCGQRAIKRLGLEHIPQPELLPVELIAERVYDRYIVDLDEPYFHVGLVRGLSQEEGEKVYDQVQKEREEFRAVRAKRLKEMQRQRELKKGGRK